MLKKRIIGSALAVASVACALQATTPLEDAIAAYQRKQIAYHELYYRPVFQDEVGDVRELERMNINFNDLSQAADEIRQLILGGADINTLREDGRSIVAQTELFEELLQSEIHRALLLDDTDPRNIVYSLAPRLRSWAREAEMLRQVVPSVASAVERSLYAIAIASFALMNGQISLSSAFAK